MDDAPIPTSAPATPPYRRVTLLDVARAAGVSKTAASRALGGYANVGPTTRARIQQLARELGYRPSVRARSLVAGKGARPRCAVVSLGMTSAEVAQSFYGPVLTGIVAQAASEHLDLHLLALPGAVAESAALLAGLMAEDGADAVLLLTHFPLTPDDIRPLEAAGLPFVLVNRHLDEHPVPYVAVDWSGAAQAAVAHFLALGHRRLALLLPEEVTSAVSDREQGWRAGLAAGDLPAKAAPVVRYAGFPEEGGRSIASRLLTEGLPADGAIPTAILAFNDACAYGVLCAARQLAVAVPDQLSVIGFDNRHAAYTTPPLCSFEPHLYELGVSAVALLRTALRGEAPAPLRLTLRPDLVCRGSCGPAPHRGPLAEGQRVP